MCCFSNTLSKPKVFCLRSQRKCTALCERMMKCIQNTSINSSGFFMWAESTLMFILKGKLKETFHFCFIKGELLFSNTPTSFDVLHQSLYQATFFKWFSYLKNPVQLQDIMIHYHSNFIEYIKSHFFQSNYQIRRLNKNCKTLKRT